MAISEGRGRKVGWTNLETPTLREHWYTQKKSSSHGEEELGGEGEVFGTSTQETFLEGGNRVPIGWNTVLTRGKIVLIGGNNQRRSRERMATEKQKLLRFTGDETKDPARHCKTCITI